MESILVTKTDDNYYAIKQGDKSSNHLGYDEMLGLFAALSMPENRPCLNWMKTDAQHKAEQEYFESIKERNSKRNEYSI